MAAVLVAAVDVGNEQVADLGSSAYFGEIVLFTAHPPRERCVRDAMLREPAVHDRSASIADARESLLDDHVHMVLLVEAERLIATVERQDLAPFHRVEMSACSIGVLSGRTIGPDAPLSEAATAMQRGARRRLAVVDDRGFLLGLLCLKASGNGFCSDRDVRNRREGSPNAATFSRAAQKGS